MNLMHLPPPNVFVHYTVSELRALPKVKDLRTYELGFHDKSIKADDYEFVLARLFPLPSYDQFIYFYGIRFDGTRRTDLRPFFLLDFWQNGVRLCPGVFDAEAFRVTAKLSDEDGWCRFEGGCCSPSTTDPALQKLQTELIIGVRKQIPEQSEFSLRLCYEPLASAPWDICAPVAAMRALNRLRGPR